MKRKVLLMSILFGLIICLTGCGNKPSTLVCTQKVSTVDIALTTNFVGKKVNSMALKYTMDLSSYSDSVISTLEKQDFCSKVQSSISQFTLVNCKQSIENKELLVTSDIDINKIEGTDLTGSPEATKVSLEKTGYTCELK